jgi:hypothetical protein
MEWELPRILSVSIHMLIVIVMVAAGCAALSKRAVLLGIGFLLLGLSGAVGWIFSAVMADWLYSTAESELTYELIPWFWPLNSVLSLLAYVLILVGVFKLPKSD